MLAYDEPVQFFIYSKAGLTSCELIRSMHTKFEMPIQDLSSRIVAVMQ